MSENHKLPTDKVSSVISELEEPASRPRYLVFCAGLDRSVVHALRNAYETHVSQSSSLLSAPGTGYDVKIIGFYNVNLESIFNSLRLTPNLLILGPGLKAPYPKYVKEWISERHPSVMRIDEVEIDPTRLPREEYYLRTYSVVPLSQVSNRWRVANELDYGILVNLNWRRDIKIEDFDHHVINLNEIELDSSCDVEPDEARIKQAKDTSFFMRPDIKVNLGSIGVVASFFGAALSAGR